MAALIPADDFSDNPVALPTPEDITANLAPLTAATTKRVFDTATPSLGQQTIQREPTAEERFQSENVRPGTPLYTRGSEVGVAEQPDVAGMERAPGISLGLTSPLFRFQMARRQGLNQQLKYARNKLGEENARLSKDGKEIIVTVPNPEEPGKQMDVTVNDRDMTLGDFAALAAHVPEFAGAIAGLAAVRAGRPEGAKGFLNYLKDIIGGSVGQEVAGGLSEAETRLEDLEVVNPGQLATERAKNLIPDVTLGLAFGGAGALGKKAIQFAAAPFAAARTEIQSGGIAASERLKQATGQNLTLSAGQASGSAPVIFGEKYLQSTAAGSATMEKLAAQQAAEKQALFEALTSGSGTDEEVGQRLVTRLQSIRNEAESGLRLSKEAIEEKAGSRISTALGNGTATELTPVQAGEKLRSEIMAEHGTVMTEKRRLYDEAYQVAGATDPIVPTKGITDAMQNIKLPMRTTPQGTKEPVSEFLHPEVRQFLETKLDPNMPIQEVVQMRDMLWDSINRGEAVKGLPTKQLTEISHAMTKAIDDGISNLPAGSQLKAKLGEANKFYKERVLKFEEAGIADIFKEAGDPGFKEAHQIIQRLTTDPGKYQRTIKLLGPTSEGAKTVRTFVRDDLLRKSASDIDPSRMEAKRFITNLRQLREDHPDIYNDVIGARGNNILEDATLMGTAQGSINVADAERSLTGKQSINELADLVKSQRKADDVQLNQLLKSYTKGNLDVNTLNPESVINGFMSKGTQSEITKLMDAIRSDNPVLGKQIERKMTEKIFEQAGGKKATDESIKKVFEDPTTTAKYKAVLGDTQFKLVEDVANFLAPIRRAEDIAKGTGSLVKGNTIGKFFKALISVTAPTKEIAEILEYRVMASAITNPKVRQWILNTPPAMHQDLARAYLISEPFLSALAEDIKDKSRLSQVVTGIRKMLSVSPKGEPANTPPTQLIPADQF